MTLTLTMRFEDGSMARLVGVSPEQVEEATRLMEEKNGYCTIQVNHVRGCTMGATCRITGLDLENKP